MTIHCAGELTNYITDYYGHTDYIGKDSYGYHNNPSNPYLVPGHYELDGKSIYPIYHEMGCDPIQKTARPGDGIYTMNDQNKYDECNRTNYESQSFDTDVITSYRKDNPFYHREFNRDLISHVPIEMQDIVVIKDKAVHIKSSFFESTIPTDSFAWSIFKKEGLFHIVFYYGKRKLYWNLWESKLGRFDNYDQFKRHWNYDNSFFRNIEKQFKKELKKDIKNSKIYDDFKNELRKSVYTEIAKKIIKDDPFGTRSKKR